MYVLKSCFAVLLSASYCAVTLSSRRNVFVELFTWKRRRWKFRSPAGAATHLESTMAKAGIHILWYNIETITFLFGTSNHFLLLLIRGKKDREERDATLPGWTAHLSGRADAFFFYIFFVVF